mmetsp:Transcript_29392/g.32671  ORF Transcript_29392/g.32671 Transcript_29392/m.32671 type:complete len:88 (+) Transcript_29392:234-497(+)
MNTWTQDEYLGLRIRSVDVKSAEKAANNAANNYNLTNSENLTFVYWGNPQKQLISWYRSFVLWMTIPNAIWFFITMVVYCAKFVNEF